MAKKKRAKKTTNKKTAPQPAFDADESRASVAMTVAWMVSMTTVLLCIATAVMGMLYVRAYPDSEKMPVLVELMLLAGAVTGLISLGLLAVVARVRRTPPPLGLMVFSACVAVAPILTLVLRMLQAA